MARLIRKAKQYGFTLVELLIVVAIMGVLSTIGIPSFRRMVQKSKKQEAKSSLGGLYTAEQSFFSEYGAFGNHLPRVGYQDDGNTTNLMYSVGFPTGACATTAAAATDILPKNAAGNPIGQAIVGTYPDYYVVSPGFAAGVFPTVLGNSNPNRPAATRLNTCYTAGAAIIKAPLDQGGAQVLNVYDVGGISNRFIAAAQGVISPNVNKVAPGATKNLDVWLIDERRQLVNAQDGVDKQQ